MASNSLRRSLQMLPNNGAATAKKMADLYIRQNTNSAGDVKDPGVYQYAVATYLAPYSNDLGVQQTIAGYQNKIKSLSVTQADEGASVAIFKQQELDLLLKKNDSIRDPWKLAQDTNAVLDGMLLAVTKTIADRQESGKSIDSFLSYQRELAQRADDMRSLVNEWGGGTLQPNLDGYGMFVQTDPSDGSIRGAALLPVGSAPTELKDGMKRISNSATVGTGSNSASLPVYLPTTKDGKGSDIARLGDNTWTDLGGGTLSATGKGKFNSDRVNFSLDDAQMFPVGQSGVNVGSFARVATGQKNGVVPGYDFYYRGQDGSLYKLDQNSYAEFSKDANLGSKLKGFVPLLSPTDVEELGYAKPLSSQDIQGIEQSAIAPSVGASPAATPSEPGFFQKLWGGVKGIFTPPQGTAQATPAAAPAAPASPFFSRQNTPAVPQSASQSSNGATSAPDLISSAGSNLAKFFGGLIPPAAK